MIDLYHFIFLKQTIIAFQKLLTFMPMHTVALGILCIKWQFVLPLDFP